MEIGQARQALTADEIFDLLKSTNRALCVAETEERTTPDVVTADFSYYRFRKPTYTPDERHAMVGRIREHLGQGRNVRCWSYSEFVRRFSCGASFSLRGSTFWMSCRSNDWRSRATLASTRSCSDASLLFMETLR